MPFIREKALEILITQIILVTSNAYEASFKVPANLTAYQCALSCPAGWSILCPVPGYLVCRCICMYAVHVCMYVIALGIRRTATRRDAMRCDARLVVGVLADRLRFIVIRGSRSFDIFKQKLRSLVIVLFYVDLPTLLPLVGSHLQTAAHSFAINLIGLRHRALNENVKVGASGLARAYAHTVLCRNGSGNGKGDRCRIGSGKGSSSDRIWESKKVGNCLRLLSKTFRFNC